MRECISLRSDPRTDPPVSAAIRPGSSRASTPESQGSRLCCAETPGNIRPDKGASDGSLRCRSRLPPPAFGSTSDRATAERCRRIALASFRRRAPPIRGAASSRRTSQIVKFPAREHVSAQRGVVLGILRERLVVLLGLPAQGEPQRDDTAATGRRPNMAGVRPGSSGRI